MNLRPTILLLAAALLAPVPSSAQTPTDAYIDEGARELVRLARVRLNTFDRRIDAYTTTARERFSASLRAGIAEKLVYRRETVTRIEWQKDGPLRLEILGMREVAPLFDADATVPDDLTAEILTLAFDPGDPQMLLRVDTTAIRHPLAEGGEAHYRFASGDTTIIRLPDGRAVSLRELRIIARRRDPQLINGSFWLDKETHAVVQAYFKLARAFDADRPAEENPAMVTIQAEQDTGRTRSRSIELTDLPGFMRPIRADIDFIAIDYGLWDLRWWLPRLVAARGFVQINRFRIPLAYERTYEDYTVRGDTTRTPVARTDALTRPCRAHVTFAATADAGLDSLRQAQTDSARARRGRYAQYRREQRGDTTAIADCERDVIIAAAADSVLLHSTELPASPYGDDVELMSDDELSGIVDRVRSIADAPWRLEAPRFQLPWQGAGLLRYNRIEGLSLGARTLFDLGPASLDASARFGVADLEPRGELALDRQGDLLHTLVAGYRRLSSASSPGSAHATFASLGALLLGRDDEQYYDALGSEITISPRASRTQWYDLRVYAERQRAVERSTDFSVAHLLDSNRSFRENFAADAADQIGARLRLRAALGKSPAAPRIAGELSIAGETGDYRIVRPEALLRFDTPLAFGVALGLEGAAGTVEGSDVPAQAGWWLGGASTLRGYPGASIVGERYWRGRAELAYGVPAVRLALFSDAGWAGPRSRFDTDGTRLSAGLGATFLDGLFRIDLARGFESPGGWRIHVHFDDLD